MRVRVVVVTVAALLLVLVTGAPAQAKGADRVTITGPGLAHPIVVAGYGEPGSGEDLGVFSEGSGMFVAVLGVDDGQGLSTEAPAGPLGPKYDLAYGFPGAVEQFVHQDLYPSAPGGPVTYTPPGQSVFGGTRSGWYQSPVEFARLLVKLGVPGVTVLGQAPTSPPATTVAAAPVTERGDSGVGIWWWLAGGGLVLVAAGALGWALLRRRRQASPA